MQEQGEGKGQRGHLSFGSEPVHLPNRWLLSGSLIFYDLEPLGRARTTGPHHFLSFDEFRPAVFGSVPRVVAWPSYGTGRAAARRTRAPPREINQSGTRRARDRNCRRMASTWTVSQCSSWHLPRCLHNFKTGFNRHAFRRLWLFFDEFMSFELLRNSFAHVMFICFIRSKVKRQTERSFGRGAAGARTTGRRTAWQFALTAGTFASTTLINHRRSWPASSFRGSPSDCSRWSLHYGSYIIRGQITSASSVPEMRFWSRGPPY